MHIANVRPVESLEVVLVAPEDGVVLVKAVEQRQQAAAGQPCRPIRALGQVGKVDLPNKQIVAVRVLGPGKACRHHGLTTEAALQGLAPALPSRMATAGWARFRKYGLWACSRGGIQVLFQCFEVHEALGSGIAGHSGPDGSQALADAVCQMQQIVCLWLSPYCSVYRKFIAACADSQWI